MQDTNAGGDTRQRNQAQGPSEEAAPTGVGYTPPDGPLVQGAGGPTGSATNFEASTPASVEPAEGPADPLHRTAPAKIATAVILEAGIMPKPQTSGAKSDGATAGKPFVGALAFIRGPSSHIAPPCILGR
jgi:hypothetical protein